MPNGGGNGLNIHLGQGSGLPFLTRKSSAPLYKENDPFSARPKMIRKARADVLDLSDPKQFAYYQKLNEAAGLGIIVLADEDRHWVEDTKNFKVFVRWFMVGQMDPSELRDAKLTLTKEIYSLMYQENSDGKDSTDRPAR